VPPWRVAGQLYFTSPLSVTLLKQAQSYSAATVVVFAIGRLFPQFSFQIKHSFEFIVALVKMINCCFSATFTTLSASICNLHEVPVHVEIENVDDISLDY
jgi:hypothetical protein